MKLLIGAVTNSSTYAAIVPIYAPLVLFTHPNENWIDLSLPQWHCVWKTVVFLGATLQRLVLSIRPSRTLWFPYAEKDGLLYRRGLINAEQIKRAGMFLMQKAGEGGKGGLWDFIVHDKSYAPRVSVTGILNLWWPYERVWQEAGELISWFQSNQPVGIEEGNPNDQAMWTALSLFPPGAVPEQGAMTVLSTVPDREEQTANLVFCWVNDRQIAWGIESDQVGGELWAGRILSVFSGLNALLTLYNVPYPGYFSSLYRVYVNDDNGNDIGTMHVWATVSIHIPKPGGLHTAGVVSATNKILSFPQVKEVVQEEINTRDSGVSLFTAIWEDRNIRISRVARISAW